jgi:hypothetical protein
MPKEKLNRLSRILPSVKLKLISSAAGRTGITAYLEAGGTLENAQAMAA